MLQAFLSQNQEMASASINYLLQYFEYVRSNFLVFTVLGVCGLACFRHWLLVCEKKKVMALI